MKRWATAIALMVGMITVPAMAQYGPTGTVQADDGSIAITYVCKPPENQTMDCTFLVIEFQKKEGICTFAASSYQTELVLDEGSNSWNGLTVHFDDPCGIVDTNELQISYPELRRKLKQKRTVTYKEGHYPGGLSCGANREYTRVLKEHAEPIDVSCDKIQYGPGQSAPN